MAISQKPSEKLRRGIALVMAMTVSHDSALDVGLAYGVLATSGGNKLLTLVYKMMTRHQW